MLKNRNLSKHFVKEKDMLNIGASQRFVGVKLDYEFGSILVDLNKLFRAEEFFFRHSHYFVGLYL